MSFFEFENKPSAFAPLFKSSTNGKKINRWTVEVQDNKYRTVSGYNDGIQTYSEWTVCQGKNQGKRNETTPAKQALAEAEALYRKRQEKGYTTDISQSNKKAYFEPMLALDYKERKADVYYPCYSQPKLDGIRCIAKADGLWSRNGKLIVSVPHIFKALKPLFIENPDLILDGELYADKFATDFDSLTSIVKKTKPTFEDLEISKESMQYWIYDVASIDDVFIERYNKLCELNFNPEYFEIVETSIVNNEEEIQELYQEYVDKGFEGQMVRLNEPYQNKRTKYLLKHKSFVNEEYIILGVEEGKGNRTGMIGKMKFKTQDGEEFDSNVKASWPRLKQMWKERDELIGKQATIKYFNLTPRGVPRFGYVVAIRDYE